jgi:uncharacterized protein YxjI
MNDRKSVIVKLIALMLIILIASSAIFARKPIGEHTEYECDVKNLRLSTDIIISRGGEKISKVTGNIFRLVEEPLTMKDMDGNKMAYAGDDYHFIAQDSHVIIADGVVAAEMVGRFKLFGEKYDIYDSDGNKMATVKFNWWDTSGEMYDPEGKLIADYSSFILFNDFDVRITDDCEIDDTTVLMIFCSYYSDQKYDSSQ